MRTLNRRLTRLEHLAPSSSSALALLQKWHRERRGKPSRLPICGLDAPPRLDLTDDGGALKRFLRGEA